MGSGTGDLRFAWRAEAEAASYTIRIADTASLATPVVAETVATPYWIYHLNAGVLQEKQYYWAVTQTDSSGMASPRSPVREILLSRGDSVLPLYPPNSHSVADQTVSRLKFSWRSAVAGETVFQLSTDPGFGTFVTDEAVRGSEYRQSLLAAGTYYWRIKVTDGDERVLFSPARTLLVTATEIPRVRLDNPAPGARLSAIAGSSGSEALRWSSRDTARNTRLVLSVNPDPLQGRPLLDIRNPSLSVPLPALEPGTYYWTVRATSNDGADMSPAAPASFTVDPPLSFPAPGNRRPASGFVLGVKEVQQSKQISFAWNAVTGANRYQLTIFSLEGGRRTQIFQSDLLNATSYAFTDLALLKGRNFLWTVEALIATNQRIDQRGTPGENTFTVDIPLPKVTIAKPGALYGE
jgi:hypothetical protein